MSDEFTTCQCHLSLAHSRLLMYTLQMSLISGQTAKAPTEIYLEQTSQNKGNNIQ